MNRQAEENAYIVDQYTITRNAIREGNYPAPLKSTRSESISGNKRKTIWPVDIVGNPFDKYQEIAHLLPAGIQAHEEWFGVAAAVMGLSETASVCEQLMATRGVRKEYTDDQDDDAEDGKPTPVHLQTDNTKKASRRTAAAASSKQPEKAESRSRGRRGAAAASKQPEKPRKSSSPPAEKKRSPLARDTKKRKGDGLVATRTKKKGRAPVKFDETNISQDSTRSSLARKLLMDHTGVDKMSRILLQRLVSSSPLRLQFRRWSTKEVW